jgi:hypothetical protein
MILRRAPTICLIGLLLGNCPVTRASAAQRAQGMLEIQIKDHRDAIGDFSKLNIAIEKLLISPQPGLKFWRAGWHELKAIPDTIDLTLYAGGTGVRVYRGAIDAGGFDAFHLKVKTIEGLLKKNKHGAAVKNTVGPVKLTFNVAAQGETLLIIDLVVSDFSDHPPRGYELGVKGYQLFTNGKLVEKIPPG